MLRVCGYYDELEGLVKRHEDLFKSISGHSFLISGAAGLIGSYLIDLLIAANREFGLLSRVAAYDRNEDLPFDRSPSSYGETVQCLAGDICTMDLPSGAVDYLIHWPSDYKPVLPRIRCLSDATLGLLIYLTGDTSLARFQSDGTNLENMYPVKVGPGSIKDSIIQIGDEKGQNVFEAAAKDFIGKGEK